MVTGLLASVYGKIVKIRNRRYDRDEKLITKLSVPIISVGNLSVGGTGKTPFVQMLAKELIAMKYKPAIVGRGYKRKSKGEVVVCDGKKLLVSAREGGDEMVLLASSLNIPVVAHDSKAEGAISAERRFDINCIIIDDGFQHRALKRNIDIVLVDNETIENPNLLPKGRLREPLESLERADVVCLTGDMKITPLLREKSAKDTIFIKVKPLRGEPYLLDSRKKLNPQDAALSAKGIVPIAGIAKPFRFFQMLKVGGYKTITPTAFSDHHFYNRNDIEKIKRICETSSTKYIATTEKDAAKLIEFIPRFNHYGIKVLVFPIHLKITFGREEFISLIKVVLG